MSQYRSRTVSRKVVVGTVAVGLLFFGLPGLALAGQTSPNDVTYKTYYRSASLTNQGDHSGDWKHCMYVTAQKVESHPVCTKNVTVTLTVTGQGGYSAANISGAVGFNVSYATSFGDGQSWDVAPGKSGWADAGARYTQYLSSMESRTCVVNTGSCSAWSSPQKVTVQKFLGDTYLWPGP